MSVRCDELRAGVRRRARPAPACSRRAAPRPRPATCGCWPRSPGSTGGRAPAPGPAGDPGGPDSRASSSTAAGSRRTSPRTSWSPWSPPCGPATRRSRCDYPARYLFAFLANHGMLSVFGSPQWRTVTGGSREYVERGRRGSPTIRLSHRSPRCAATRTRVEVTDARRRDAPRSTPWSSPPTRTRRCAMLEPTRRPPSATCSARIPYSAQPRPAAHRRHRCCPAAAAPGRRGTTCSAAASRTTRRGHGQLRHDPAAGPAGGEDYIVTLGGEDLVDPARSSTGWSTRTRSTPRPRSRPSGGCPG